MTEQSIEWQRYNLQLPDGGSHYAETNMAQFIVEPWNALSSLLFLIPALYWAIKIRKQVKENAFIAYCVPLLILGGLGSTLFHAFRTSSLLLLMDVLPILILTLSVSTYFWQKIFNKWWLTTIVVAVGFILRRLVVDIGYFPYHTAANISYAISGITIFLPILIVLFKTNFQKGSVIFSSILLFVLALTFREMDAWELNFLPMGTHFLWHFCTAAGAYFIARYIYIFPGFGTQSARLVPQEVEVKA
ncbi:MAG TPA: ceramidase domain-containing protein [Cytophagales bacterium]|nr:ceramidase domain-containing protein [Cytophagales bacterium]